MLKMTTVVANHYYLHSLQFNMKRLIGILIALTILAGTASFFPAPDAAAALLNFDSFGNVIPQAGKTKPALPGGGVGFGGFIAGVTSCVCKDIGVLIKIVGPYGGNYLFSFTHRPSFSVGSFFAPGLPVLGSAKSGGSCGTISHGDCDGEDTDGTITMIGGIL
jgi:hypothetical protein